MKTVSTEEALSLLRDGNARFVAGKPQHPRCGPDRVRETLAEQHPFAAVLACSDSRVSPELVFDAGIGDLFTVRNAGGHADKLGLASLDFAAHSLEVPLVVVLGHTGCIAVKAAIDKPPLPGRIPDAVNRVRSGLVRLLNQRHLLKPEELYHKAVVQNTREALAAITRDCPLLRKRMLAGTLKAVAALYHLETGAVEWLD